MSDNTVLNTGTGGDTYAADDITDGGVASGAKAQRIKAGFGTDGNFTDASASAPFPVRMPESVPVTGTITVTDTGSGLYPSATGVPNSISSPTAGSYVFAAMRNGDATAFVTIDTFATGVYAVERSNNSTDGVNGTWSAALGRTIGASTESADTYLLSATGTLAVPCMGATYVRVRNLLGTFSGSTTNVKIQTSAAQYSVTLRGIPRATIDQASPGASNLVSVTPGPTTNNLTAARIVSTAGTNATSVKTTAGKVASIQVSNDSASKAFLKLYNKASAPTVGTDTPVLTVLIPAGATWNSPWADFGRFFSTGIAYAITGAVGDSDTTAVATGVTGEILYA